MKNLLKKIFKVEFLPPLLILGLVVFLSWVNHTPGTILSGWDTLHPEFNFKLAFSRAISGVWREEQGLGVLAAHSHMADLPRIIFLWVSSITLPVNFLRYLYFFVTLAIGPLGVYFFIRYTLGKTKSKLAIALASLLGGVQYLLNLGTLQHFYVPFEMFATQYAFLPWLFLYARKYTEESKKRSLTVFAILTLLSAPMAFAATLFYAYLFALGIFLFTFMLVSNDKIQHLKRTFVLIATTLLLSSYWILPNIYSIKTQSETIYNSKINRLFSPEAFLHNKNYGTAENLALQKNFLFSWQEHDIARDKFVPLLDEWSIHVSNPKVKFLGFSFAAIALAGVVISMIKRDKNAVSMFPVAIIALFFLFNENPPLGEIYSYLNNNITLFREGLRMPFTKFSIIFMFAFSYYFAYFFYFAFSLFSRVKLTVLLSIFMTVLAVVALAFYMRPAFDGNLISKSMKTDIPKYYFEAFTWFNQNPEGKIAKLPLPTFAGWTYHSWDYEGAGFIPFGLNSPTLDRDFDRWSEHNETFYKALNFSVNFQNETAFNEVLKKHQIMYVLLDESVVKPTEPTESLHLPQINQLLADSDFKQVATFGPVTIYEARTEPDKNNLWIPSAFTKVSAEISYSSVDQLYAKHGTYIVAPEGSTHPFINLESHDTDFSVTNQQVDIRSKVNELFYNTMFSTDSKTYADLSDNTGFPEPSNCNPNSNVQVVKEIASGTILYRAENNGASCDFIAFPDLSHSQAYLFRISGRNTEGRSLKIYISNNATQTLELEELLPSGDFDETFIIPSKNVKSAGYSLNYETRSFGRIASENILEKVEFIPLPQNWLSSVQIGTPAKQKNEALIGDSTQIGSAIYKANFSADSKNSLITLSQGHDNGWIAFTGTKILPHVKVSSWANGWLVPEGEHTVYIFFWPQALQWIGFALIPISLYFIYKKA